MDQGLWHYRIKTKELNFSDLRCIDSQEPHDLSV